MKKMNEHKLSFEQKELVENYYYLTDLVVNLLHHVSQNHITSKYLREDAIQDASYALCIAACTYNKNNAANASFKTYAQKVIYNHLCCTIKKQKQGNDDISYEELDSELCDTEAYSEEEICKKVLVDNVRKIINERRATGATSYKTAYDFLFLHYLRDYKITTIAQKYNTSRKTVYKRLNMAIEDLKNVLCNAM